MDGTLKETDKTHEIVKNEIVKAAQDFFRQSSAAESENRERAVEDLRFVDLGEQWDDATKNEREEDGRPCFVINKVAGSIRQIVNDARQNKPRIKIRPVDDKADPKVAELLTGLIRNIENDSDADAAYDTGIEFAAKAGWGYWRVLTEYAEEGVFEQDIRIARITNPFSVYDDPQAKEADRSDRDKIIISETLPRSDFEEQYPDFKEQATWDKGTGEANADWVGEDTVRVAEYYYRVPVTKTIWQIATPTEQGVDYDTIEVFGTEDVQVVDGQKVMMTERGPAMVVKERSVKTKKVMWCKVAGNAIVEGPIEQAGKYIPVVYCAGDESWIEGKPVLKSAHYHAKDSQRLYNWARSNAVETLALSPKQPFIGTPEMFEGFEGEWDEAHRKPKMRLLANYDQGNLPERQPLGITDNGALNEAMQSADDIKATTGLFDASLGAKGNETSGRAIIARQRESDVSTFHFHDNQARALKFTGKILVDLIPKIYDTERVVRVLNEDGSESWGEINKRIPDVTNPNGYRVVNDLSIGRYDVVVESGPNYGTKRIEAADGMVQMLTSAPNAMPVILPRLAKNLDWPEANEIAEELKQLFNPQQPPQPDPKQEAEIEGKRLDNAKKAQELQRRDDQLSMALDSATLEGKQLDNAKKAQELQAMDERMAQIAQSVIMQMLQGVQ